MPRHEENMAAEKKRRRQEKRNRMFRIFGSSIQNLASDFDSVESPKKKQARHNIITKRSMSKADPSSRKTKHSRSNRRGKIGKFPTSNGAPKIDKNAHRIALLGVDVEKYLTDEETGKQRLFSGRVTGFDPRHDLYKVRYEDGDEEEEYSCELEEMLDSKMKDSTVHHDTNINMERKKKKKKRSKTKKTHSVLEKVC